MGKTVMIAITVLVLGLSITAQAGFFDFFQTPKISLDQNQTTYVTQDVSKWDNLKTDLQQLNTSENITSLSRIMQQQNVDVVQVDVTDQDNYIGTFYIVKDVGIVFQPPEQQVDRTFRVSEQDVRSIIDMLSDGEVSLFERIRIWMILQNSEV